jgi:hypothetical protein
VGLNSACFGPPRGCKSLVGGRLANSGGPIFAGFRPGGGPLFMTGGTLLGPNLRRAGAMHFSRRFVEGAQNSPLGFCAPSERVQWIRCSKLPPGGFEHLIDGGGIDGWHFDVHCAQHDRGRTVRSAGVQSLWLTADRFRLSTLASQPSTIRAEGFLDQYSRMYTDVQISFSAGQGAVR